MTGTLPITAVHTQDKLKYIVMATESLDKPYTQNTWFYHRVQLVVIIAAAHISMIYIRQLQSWVYRCWGPVGWLRFNGILSCSIEIWGRGVAIPGFLAHFLLLSKPCVDVLTKHYSMNFNAFCCNTAFCYISSRLWSDLTDQNNN